MPFAELVDLDVVTTRNRRRAQADSAVTAFPAGRSKPRRTGMTSAMFARQIEERAKEEMARRMAHACGELSPDEVETLIQRTADMRARYYAALLETGASRGVPQKDQFAELEALRHWAEELESGLEHLKDRIARGEVRVRGVDADTL